MSAVSRTDLDAAYAACEATVRDGDRDRWLAALFVPADRRRHVLALTAFALEIARVRDQIRDPMPGEIRLRWWADTLEGVGTGDAAASPMAAALLDTVSAFGLPVAPLVAMVEARRFDLYDDAMPSLNDLEGYAGETASTLLQQAALVLSGGGDPGAADASGHAGVAYALTGLMRALPIHARRGQCFLPVDLLARHGAAPDMVRAAMPTPQIAAALAELREHARHHRARALAALARVPVPVRAAYVGLGLVDPYLAALGAMADPFGAVAEVAAWKKPLRLWRFSRALPKLG
jgi:phytoene synthase